MSAPSHPDVSSALAMPEGYPPLAQAVFPGDRVVVVPDEFAVSQPHILVEVLTALLGAGVDEQDITVMLTESDQRDYGAALQATFDAAFRGSHSEDSGVVRISVHHPASRQDLALLATDERDEPVAINREIVDADFVLLVQRKSGRASATGDSALYPRFADMDAIYRFAQIASTGKHEENAKGSENKKADKGGVRTGRMGKMLKGEIRRVHSLLGIGLILEVHPVKKQTTFRAYSPEIW